MSIGSEASLDVQNISEEEDAFLLRDWRFLSAVAWRHFLSKGPGTLIITICDEENAELNYLSKAEACSCCQHLLREYDAGSQIVASVRKGERESIYVLAGFPTPPEAYAQAPAGTFDEVLH